jgi:hypothetical protein
MKIARYWVKGKAEAAPDSGETITVATWGWSEQSREEAQQRANEAAQRAARRIGAGEPLPRWYGYSDRPPREEIVEEIKNADGETFAAITRNSYGVLVLNTRDLMFIDIDIPTESPGSRFIKMLKNLFGSKPVDDDPESRIRTRILNQAALHPNYTFRVYRTFAGFRCAVINRPVSPDSPESKRLLDDFGADPLYVVLCQNQQSYRARLTPKYWRCGASRPPNRFPWATHEEEQKYRAWERAYREQSRPFAVCRLVKQFGAQEGSAELMTLINLHDELTGANTELKLA